MNDLDHLISYLKEAFLLKSFIRPIFYKNDKAIISILCEKNCESVLVDKISYILNNQKLKLQQKVKAK